MSTHVHKSKQNSSKLSDTNTLTLFKALQKTKGELTYAEKAAFYATVDHALYSEVNEELMRQIVKMFDDNL